MKWERLRKRFDRSESFGEKIEIEGEELKEILKKWLQGENWSPKDFESMLKEAMVNLPIRLENFQKEGLRFEGKTPSDDQYQFQIQFGDSLDCSTELEVKRRYTVRRYTVARREKRRKSKEILSLCQKKMAFGNRKMICQYTDLFCNWELSMPGDKKLVIYFDEPQQIVSKKEAKLWILSQRDEIESFLFSIIVPENVDGIYNALVNLFHLTPEFIRTCPKIHLRYEIGEEVKCERLLEYGKMHRYVVTEGEKTYCLYDNSSWYYRDAQIEIRYIWTQEGKNGAGKYSVSGLQADSPKERIQEVLEQIHKLQEVFKQD